MKTKTQTQKAPDLDIQKDLKFKEIASGGVVFYRKDDISEPKFLLLKHKGRKKQWDLPKGHLKKHETIKECAIREILEESGIPQEKLILIKELNHKNIYVKRRSFGKKYRKIVHLFLFQSLTHKIKLSSEHTNSKWVKFDQLDEKLTYPQTSLLAFVEALEIIRNL